MGQKKRAEVWILKMSWKKPCNLTRNMYYLQQINWLISHNFSTFWFINLSIIDLMLFFRVTHTINLYIFPEIGWPSELFLAANVLSFIIFSWHDSELTILLGKKEFFSQNRDKTVSPEFVKIMHACQSLQKY